MEAIPYDELERRLTSDALQLLQEMAAAHVESTGDRMFIRSDTMAGSRMHFTGQGSSHQFKDFDGGAVDDLVSWGLLHVGFSARGTPNYRVSGEGLHFYRWLKASRGTAVVQVEDDVRKIVDGEASATAHAGAAHHLREAFQLLWSGRTEDQAVSEIGDHLRKALMDTVTDVLGADVDGHQERPIERLEAHLKARTVPEREAAASSCTSSNSRGSSYASTTG